MDGDLNSLSSGRVTESVSALEYLISNDLFYTGAGLGGTFMPWPDKRL